VADVASTGAAQRARLADAVWREVVVVDVALRLVQPDRVDRLLVCFGAQRGNAQDLRLTACEQARAMRPRQHADLDRYRADLFGAASVGASALLEDLGADEVLLE